MTNLEINSASTSSRVKLRWFYNVLLVIILLAAAYFRFIGINWDQSQHLHPDERFMTMVESALESVHSVSDYFNTDVSTLNPHNRGYTFYVYGDLPVTIVRYAAEWLSAASIGAANYLQNNPMSFGNVVPGSSGNDFFGALITKLGQPVNWAGYDEVTLVGRVFSALSDIFSIFLLYLIGMRLYGRKVAVLAAAFSAMAVMQIQESHFFTVDMFANFFMILAVYFAVEVMLRNGENPGLFTSDNPVKLETRIKEVLLKNLKNPLVWNVIGFGLALGASVASKLNAAPLALLLPAALLIRYFRVNLAVNIAAKQPVYPSGEPITSEEISSPENTDAVKTNPVTPWYEIPENETNVVEGETNTADTVPGSSVVVRTQYLASPIQGASPLLESSPFVDTVPDPSGDASALTTKDPGNVLADDDDLPGFTNHTEINGDHPKQFKPHFSLESAIVLLLLGALVSALAFRVFMPYAFSGPGFFGVTPNPKWVANITEQRAQAGGDVDFPPALQWARRPIWFSAYNLLSWGLGWPLGILSFLGLLYMGWRIIKGEWKEHILIWGWTGAYFVWQSLQWNSTMRYQLPIYPLLALMAAWFIFNGPRSLLSRSSKTQDIASLQRRKRISPVGIAYFLLALVVLLSTAGWAYAFTRIYTRDHSRVQATRWIYQNVPGPYNLKITQADGSLYTQPMSISQGFILEQSTPFDVQFTSFATGTLTDISLGHAVNAGNFGSQTLTISIADSGGIPANEALANGTLTSDFGVTTDPRGQSYTLKLNRPVALEKDRTYFLRFTTSGALSMTGSAPIQESSWDDALPLRMDGYDGFGGMYQGDLNFEMYWDDSAEKLSRFETNLNVGDYIFISSDRQWATTTRVPERYPLTTAYYRELIGCPAEKDVIWCYNVAAPGMFSGQLGFELIKTFTSYPEIVLVGSDQKPALDVQFNTQFAEEAFTVYDAPKVLIFKKTDAFDSNKVHALLGAVDLTHIVHLTPRQAGRVPGDLMLPADMLAVDRAGGTWSDLFSYESLQNKYPLLGLLIWYLTIALLGLFTAPLLRLVLPGLADKGYPLSKLSGLLLLAYFVWLTASVGGQYSRFVIAVVYGLILLAGALAFYFQRKTILEELSTKKKYYLIVEGLFLLLFLIDLGIRLGNPDLWHPARGGERPMDFSYLYAILKSSSFPPYDPWYAGGYINYYYWGFVLVGTPIKLLGIVPTIAYNFVLPTLFAMLGMGGFTVAWNLLSLDRDAKSCVSLASTAYSEKSSDSVPSRPSWFAGLLTPPVIAGLAAAVGLVLMGNLGTIQLVYHALQKMMVSGEIVEAQNSGIFQRWWWAAQGLGKVLTGTPLPIGWGEYYWAPSRVMPMGDLAITEFPLFTFLYSDLHAHMIALPLTLLGIAWTLSTLMAAQLEKLKWWSWLATLAFGGLVIGVLRPTNTWDFPTYLIFGVVVTGYAIFRYADVGEENRMGLSPIIQRVFLAVAGMGLLVGFAILCFQPFAHWYGLAYTEISQWKNEKTPIWSYLTHWGVFLFVIISWLIWETRQWLAQTPFSSLSRLKPYKVLIETAVAVFVGLLLVLQFVLDVPVAWFAFPLAVWALILILRPGQPDAKRLVLFMIGTGLVLTLVVEFIVLSGDIGRMNTVFKFYLQVWVLFTVSAAAGLGWILVEFNEWGKAGKVIFQLGGGILLTGALMFTYTASMDKIRDRIALNIPFTFDSITYMQYSSYWDQVQLDLSKDYRAIRWMQDNVKGSPVIVEGNTPEYRWGTRYTIYTGLPGVVGWSWHQRQQRALFPGEWVSGRIDEINNFYNSTDLSSATAFLTKYSVKYIIVGQMEHSMYNAVGLSKFKNGNGSLWEAVYNDADTIIYEVYP